MVPKLPAYFVARGQAHARHHRLFMNVETGTPRMHDIHLSLHLVAVGVGTSSQNSKEHAPGTMPSLGTIGGHRGAPGPTRKRALAHQAKTDLAADTPLLYQEPGAAKKFHTRRVGTTGEQLEKKPRGE